MNVGALHFILSSFRGVLESKDSIIMKHQTWIDDIKAMRRMVAPAMLVRDVRHAAHSSSKNDVSENKVYNFVGRKGEKLKQRRSGTREKSKQNRI